MRLTVFLLGIALFCCACEPTDKCLEPEVYAAGMCILSEYTVNVDEIEYTVDLLEKEVRAKGYDEVEDFAKYLDINDTHVEFIDDFLSMGCEYYENDVYKCDMHISGVNYGGTDIYVQYHKCLGITAFAHELLHSIEWFYLNGMVGEHMTPWFYEEYGIAANDPEIWMNTIEVRMWRFLICELDSCIDERTDYWACDQLE